MDAYHALAASYDRLTNDVDYKATVDFYKAIWTGEGLKPRTAVDLACGTGSVTLLLAKMGLDVTGVDKLTFQAYTDFNDATNPGVVLVNAFLHAE